ncbi:MAG: glutaredoxin family protein [Desulfopila sp.]
MFGTGMIKVYALTTCARCKALLAFLRENGQDFECVNVDQLLGKERREAVKEVKSVNKRCSFPTVLIGDQVVVGFKEWELREALGL